jgi:hypothetical protein
MCGLLALLGGCIGENPWWDAPSEVEAATTANDGDATEEMPVGDDADDDSASGDADVDSTSDGAAVSDDEGSSSGAPVPTATTDAGAGDETTSAATSDDGPICAPEQLLCDGECRDIQTDKHYCGPE